MAEKLNWWQKIRWSKFALLVIGAVASAGIGSGVTIYSNRLRSLDYTVTSLNDLVNKPDLGGRSLQIILSDPTTRPATRPIENISTATITLLNETGKDYADIHFAIRFEPVHGIKPKLILGRSKLPPEIVQEENVQDLADGSLRAGYVLKKMNRGNSVQLDYVFEGGTAPDVSAMTTVANGLELERVSTRPGNLTPMEAVWVFVKNVLAWISVITVLIAAYACGSLFSDLKKGEIEKKQAEIEEKQAKIDELQMRYSKLDRETTLGLAHG